MTATIVDRMPGTAWGIDADERTVADAVPNGPAMADYLGRSHSAPSRVHLGVLWGGNGGDTAEYNFIFDRGERRMVATGASITEPGETTVTVALHRRPGISQNHLI